MKAGSAKCWPGSHRPERQICNCNDLQSEICNLKSSTLPFAPVIKPLLRAECELDAARQMQQRIGSAELTCELEAARQT